VVIKATPTVAGTIKNTASVSATEGDPNPANNLVTIPPTVLSASPDLVETSVSSPPAAAAPGDKFSVTDTVLNQGGPAGSFRVRYYLSLDTLKSTGDKLLTGTRLVFLDRLRRKLDGNRHRHHSIDDAAQHLPPPGVRG
jgi:hypothetical protein